MKKHNKKPSHGQYVKKAVFEAIPMLVAWCAAACGMLMSVQATASSNYNLAAGIVLTYIGTNVFFSLRLEQVVNRLDKDDK